MRLIQPVSLVLATPLLLFPRGPLPWIGLLLVLASWVAARLTTGRGIIRTALDRPVLVILLTAVVSLYPSADLSLSLPKFYGLLLGVAVYHATVKCVSTERHFWIGIWLLLAGTFAVSVLGLFGTQWSDDKLPWLAGVYAVIPQLVTEVESSVGATSGIHPNELGGTLAFLLPLPVALLLASPLSSGPRAALAGVVVFSLGVLLLTASRSAMIGLAASLLALVTWRSRFAGLALLALGAALFDAVLLLDASVLERLFSIDALGVPASSASYFSRREIWDHARYMIEDFPFTGIGLNTFDLVLDTLYPLFWSAPSGRLVHAHNVYLQTAVDLGLGGLLGFLGLWATLSYVGLKAYRRLARGQRTAAGGEHFQHPLTAASRTAPIGTSLAPAVVGLLAGTLSFLVYGLTDAITLGAKPTVLLWLMAGLVVAAERLSRRRASTGLRSNAGRQPSVNQDRSPGPADSRIRSIRSQNPLTASRPLSVVLAGAREAYWILAFFLTGMGYLVAAGGLLGRTL